MARSVPWGKYPIEFSCRILFSKIATLTIFTEKEQWVNFSVLALVKLSVSSGHTWEQAESPRLVISMVKESCLSSPLESVLHSRSIQIYNFSPVGLSGNKITILGVKSIWQCAQTTGLTFMTTELQKRCTNTNRTTLQKAVSLSKGSSKS